MIVSTGSVRLMALVFTLLDEFPAVADFEVATAVSPVEESGANVHGVGI